MDLLAALVHLDADPVELGVHHRGEPGLGRGRYGVGRAGREHRLHRHPHLQPDRPQPLDPTASQRRSRRGGGRAEHRGPPHGGHWHLVRRRQALLHQRLEGALPQLAEDQATQEVLLGSGGPREQYADLLGPPCGRAGAGQLLQRGKGPVDVLHAQRGLGRGRRDLLQAAPADPGTSLAETAGR